MIENAKALELLGKVEITYWLLLGKTDEGPYDITFIERSVVSEHYVESPKHIRELLRILVSLGADACVSGIPGLRRFAFNDAVKRAYGETELEHRPI